MLCVYKYIWDSCSIVCVIQIYILSMEIVNAFTRVFILHLASTDFFTLQNILLSCGDSV